MNEAPCYVAEARMRTSRPPPPRTRRADRFIVHVLRETGPVEISSSSAATRAAPGRTTSTLASRATSTSSSSPGPPRWRGRGALGEGDGAVRGHARGLADEDLIVHDFAFVNDQVKQGQYFWRDVLTEGVLLYTSGAFSFDAKRAPHADAAEGAGGAGLRALLHEREPVLHDVRGPTGARIGSTSRRSRCTRPRSVSSPRSSSRTRPTCRRATTSRSWRTWPRTSTPRCARSSRARSRRTSGSSSC